MPKSRYPKLREMLAAPHRDLPDSVVERVVGSQGLQARAVEDFWDDLGNVVASALPAVGGAVGSIIAPGVGTAIGAGLGSAAGGALHSAIGPSKPAAAAPAAVYPSAGAGYPMAPAAPQAGSQQAAAQLIQLLMQPQMLQSLMQMMLGKAGSPTVPVATAPPSPASPVAAAPAAAVPVSAFTNLLSTLATQASEAYNAERAFTPGQTPFTYGAGPWGSSVDLASPESRAEALMTMLQNGNGPAMRTAALRRRKQRLTDVAEALQLVTARRAAYARG